jgi:epoxyqueuosine reductase
MCVPWNRFSKPHTTSEFALPESLAGFTNNDWQEITEEIFREIFRRSPVKRTKYDGLKRNIDFVISSK